MEQSIKGRDAAVLHEVRNYHFRPDLLADYKVWASTQAIPHLAKTLEVVGFWVSTDDAPEVVGAPMDAMGSANVTWVIRWRDKAHRAEAWAAATSGPEWEAVLAQVPGGTASYLRLESKFAEALV
jgi:hypothetical protein